MAENDTAGQGAGLVGGLLGTGLSFLGGSLAWKRQKAVLQNSAQWRVRDLKRAGLNPILAAGGGGAGAPAGNMPSIANLGSDITTGKKVSYEGKLKKSQTRLTDKQLDLMDVQIMGERSKVGVNSAYAQSLMADTLLKINAKDRWQPVADIGGALSKHGTTPIREAIGNIPNLLKSVGATNAHEINKRVPSRKELSDWFKRGMHDRRSQKK